MNREYRPGVAPPISIETFYYVFTALSLVIIWTYWSTLAKAADRWGSDVQYSHGWLIPAFTLYLLYYRRHMLVGQKLVPSWWGLLFLMMALALRWTEVNYYLNGFDPLSLIPILLGLALAVGGWPAFAWSWPAIVFLIFMVPLPYILHTGMSTQLQMAATQMSTFVLQTFGLPAVAEGTQLKIDDATVSVAEACSGLGMIVTFVAISVAVILMIRSPWWVKAGLLLGSIPVALICNVVRITSVAAFKSAGYKYETVETIHDIAGWLMIVLGCGLIFVELYILDRIVVVQDTSRKGDIPLPLPYAPSGRPTARPAT
ncbi:exosortase [soil metagenome]